jgi:hypothetical protein
VSVWATRKRENGGRSRRVFRAAKDTDKMTKGATILNIYIDLSFGVIGTIKKHTHQKRCHEKRSEYWD